MRREMLTMRRGMFKVISWTFRRGRKIFRMPCGGPRTFKTRPVIKAIDIHDASGAGIFKMRRETFTTQAVPE